MLLGKRRKSSVFYLNISTASDERFNVGMLTSPTSPPPKYQTSSPRPHNPLSIRLYKVLAANLDDDTTKEALHTLADLYAPSLLNDTKVKPQDRDRERLNDIDDEDDDTKEDANTKLPAQSPALAETVPGETAARARKNLKKDVESKLAESSRRFLTAFAEVDKVCIYLSFVCM